MGMATRRKLAKTVARGYGEPHRRLRVRLLATYKPSDPCPRCGQPLGHDRTMLDLGHTDDRRAWTGLEHRDCNIRASNRLRARATRRRTPTRKTMVAYTQPTPAADHQPTLVRPDGLPPRQHARDW
jgi:hypothetical protein